MAKNFATEQVGSHLKYFGDELARLGSEIKARDFLDEADVDAIRAKLATVKLVLDQVGTEVSAAGSKARKAAPVHDGSAVEGGIFDGPVGVDRVATA